MRHIVFFAMTGGALLPFLPTWAALLAGLGAAMNLAVVSHCCCLKP
jgi:hypothetical protein